MQAEDPQLPLRSVDTILLVHTYAFLPNRVEYMTKLKESLKPEGRIAIIEYIPASWEQRPWGPLPHQQVSRETVDTEMARAGFSSVKIHDFLPGQYFIEYRVKK